jgi:hypothetical protein
MEFTCWALVLEATLNCSCSLAKLSAALETKRRRWFLMSPPKIFWAVSCVNSTARGREFPGGKNVRNFKDHPNKNKTVTKVTTDPTPNNLSPVDNHHRV